MKELINNSYHKSFYVQKLSVDKTFLNSKRISFFKQFIEGKKVLHVGFVDWPITNLKNNLHLEISPLCARLDGIDPNYKEELNLNVSNGKIYLSWDEVPNDYDIILVPEVIEHVGNIESFLKLISSRNGTLIITAPDAVLLQHHFQSTDREFLEAVHPDHNYWFTPYTLKNAIDKYSEKKVVSLHWIQNQSIAAVCK
jgi:hypothetical protein